MTSLINSESTASHTGNAPIHIPPTAWAIGVDIGGTKMCAALVNLGQGLKDVQETSTPKTADAFLDALKSLIQPLLAGTGEIKPLCIGIASAGTVNSDTGEIFGSTGNLPAVRGLGNLKHRLEDLFGIPVFLENDANAAAVGEARLGAAKGATDVLMITLGTGVGAGFLVNHRLVRGAHYSAAEGGHICISMTNQRQCTCGKWDCWEAYASGPALAKTGSLVMASHPEAESSMLYANFKANGEVTTRELVAAWTEGDAIALEIKQQWHQVIAMGLGSLLNVLDPTITVVGGNMAQFVDFDRLLALTQERSMVKDITVVPAKLGNQAGMVGASLLALERVFN